MYDHDRLPPPFDDFVKKIEILFSSENVRTLKIIEAVLIKSQKPQIKVKFNELYDFFTIILKVGR